MSASPPKALIWSYILRISFTLGLLVAAAVAYLHPGLAAIRVVLTLVFGIPGVLMWWPVMKLNRRALGGSLFLGIWLLMPMFSEAWSEPDIRSLAIIDQVLLIAYLVSTVVYIRQSKA